MDIYLLDTQVAIFLLQINKLALKYVFFYVIYSDVLLLCVEENTRTSLMYERKFISEYNGQVHSLGASYLGGSRFKS